MKKLIVMLSSACAVAFCGLCTESGNTVGYQTLKIRKGPQELTIPVRDVSSKQSYKVGILLPSALDGDSIAFGDFEANARLVDGVLHWVRFGQIVDEQSLPEFGSKIAYFRSADKETELILSGETDLPEKIQATSSNPPAQPPKVTAPTPAKPKRYLTDILSYSTVHIVNEKAKGIFTGTGFFFYFRMKKDPKMCIPAIVSNRHVAEGATNSVFTFTVMKDSAPTDKLIDYITNYTTGDRWIFHEDPDVDLAVYPMLPAQNFLREKRGIEIYHTPFTTDWIPDDNYFSGLTQLDDVCMIGYPDDIWDEKNNQPIFRKGAIATRPNKNYNGKRCFLIDMAVYGGSSGSPLLIASEMPHYERASGRMNYNGRVKLIGVVHATFKHTENGNLVVCPIAEMKARVVPQVAMPNNLGIVIHASRLRELEEQLQRRFEGGVQ